MSPSEHEEFDAWLERNSTLHGELTRLDRSEPPDELDRIVLDRAREAIRAPRPLAPLRVRWALPVGLAATLLISFALLMHTGPSAVRTDTPATAPYESGPIRAADPLPEPALEAPEISADAVTAAPAPPATSGEHAQPAREMSSRPAPQRREADAPVTDSAVARKRDSNDTGTAASEERAAAAKAQAPRMESVARVRSVTEPEARRDPDEWLADIERLRVAGRIEEAEREMERFRLAYPQRALPAAAPRSDER